VPAGVASAGPGGRVEVLPESTAAAAEAGVGGLWGFYCGGGPTGRGRCVPCHRTGTTVTRQRPRKVGSA
jgi:hypothetical protein